jgi:uncharacterized membrane protein (UPF0127 family)
MRTSLAILTLLFVSLLLVAGCGGGETPTEEGQKKAVPAEKTPVDKTGAETTQSAQPESTLAIINSAGERVVVRVEIADTDAERRRGLMERTELAEDAGMLFVFDREVTEGFWMRNTLIPLSIAYIDSGGRIVDIQDMEPLDETPHPPASPYQYALEVNQGFFEAQGIEIGNVLE